jgi:hypothetical protein
MTKQFKDALRAGCVIWKTSCGCGGHYAWLTPRKSGAYTMYGCICHNKPPKVKITKKVIIFKRGEE